MRILISLFITYLICSCAHTKEISFFSEVINNDMRMDVTRFLKNIPENKGQQKHIDRVLQLSEYKNILLLIDDSFSFDVVNKVSLLENPFVLIETLDILSYNKQMNKSFSTWYLSELVSLVNSKPKIYMTSFLRLSQKSDGMYLEWFADPLSEIIKSNTEEFSKSVQEIGNYEKICRILNTGNYTLVSNSINLLRIYNEKNNFETVTKIIECFSLRLK